jgi:hypothetical protein
MADISRTFLMIPFQRTESQRFANLLQLFKILTKTDGPAGWRTVLTTWARRPVKCYIPSHVHSDSVDYRAEGLRAAQRWMEKTGFELLTLVASPPDTGITFHFKSRSEMGIHIGITRHTNGSDGLPLRDDIDLVDDMPNSHSLYLICMHELGHTLRLGHLPFPEFIMYEGQPLPPDISADEAEVVRLLVKMPARIDMSAYDETNPE